jgi:hypothetical protein
MGWYDYHLHHFKVNRQEGTVPHAIDGTTHY